MGKRKKKYKPSKYRLTLKFFEKNKRWPSASSTDLDEQRLGSWITRTKFVRNHSAEKLTQKEIELIDRIDADKSQMRMDQWEKNYYNLKDLYEGKSTLREKEVAKLKSWCQTQKQIRKGAIYGHLSEKQIAMLDAIGFEWSKNVERRTWDQSYALLRAFRKKNNRWPAHTTTKKEESKLAKWCSKMRAYRNGSDTSYKLSSEQIKKLDKLGFIWETTYKPTNSRSPEQLELCWNNRYEEFCTFINETKRYPRVEEGNAKENTLYSWWMRMAYLKRKGLLREDRIQKLNLIGFRWGSDVARTLKKKEK